MSCSAHQLDWQLALRIFASLPTAHACECCGEVGLHIIRQSCRTAYADPKKNKSPWLCPACADEYHQYWDSLWADYNSSHY